MRTWHGPLEVVRSCWVPGTRYVLKIFASNSVSVDVRFHDCAALMMKDHPHHGHSFNCSPITGLNRPQQLIYSTRHLLSSGLRWFPREINCPKRVAPEPHIIVLWHLIHEFRLIVCTSYTNSSCCTLLYSFILWFCWKDCTNCCSAYFWYTLFRCLRCATRLRRELYEVFGVYKHT